MAYSELIKDFNKIRDYMRQFYVYGFKTRDEYDAKSARSYDNERRRIESWLGDYMSFRQEPAGKVSFIAVDSADIAANPLYEAFKAKSFTANDIILNFFILDILQPDVRMSVAEITEIIDEEYTYLFEEPRLFDEATVRNKLREYAKAGILVTEKDGRRLLYGRSVDTVDLDAWKEAIAFFSEVDPVGVIGSFLLDKMPERLDLFTYKHHYILHALESDIICTLLDAITDDCTVQITFRDKSSLVIIPFLIGMSTENGRGYLLGCEAGKKRFRMFRLDRIQKAMKGDFAPEKAALADSAADFTSHLWNAATGWGTSTDHLEMTLRIEPKDIHILRRLEREGKHGRVEPLGDDRYRFTIDVFEATEMIPWIRTFIGRIEKLTCDNPAVERRFYGDLETMYEMYGMSGKSEMSEMSGTSEMSEMSGKSGTSGTPETGGGDGDAV